MPARRKHYPGRGPLTGTAGTPNAHRLCAGCRHPWFRHCNGPSPGCTTLIPCDAPEIFGVGLTPWRPCPCDGFTETASD